MTELNSDEERKVTTNPNPPEEAPERVWLVIGHADSISGGSVWATFDTQEKAENYPGPRMMEMMPRQVVCYVPASRLTEVWDEAIAVIRHLEPVSGRFAASDFKKHGVAALELEASRRSNANQK